MGTRGDVLGWSLVFELGYLIAIPLVVCAIGGRMLDRYCDTSPIFLLIGIVVAMVVSGVMVMQRIRNMERAVAAKEEL